MSDKNQQPPIGGWTLPKAVDIKPQQHSELAPANLLADWPELLKYKARMVWLHDCSSGSTDPDGCEWGIYRVKWKDGKAIEVWQTNSDFSDLDAEMAREKSANEKGQR